MITKVELQRLTDSRPKATMDLQYTIGGNTEKLVHQQVEHERVRKLNEGNRQMQDALKELRQAQAFKTREGLAKAQFNSKTQNPAMG